MEPISIAMFNNTPSAGQPSTVTVEPDAHALSPTDRKLGDTDYKYQDLHPEKNEIRLLYIQADNYETQVKCRILRVSLDNPPAFTALSYMWGDLEDTCLMILDGSEFPVTRSLCGALQALRSTYLGVVVWADAICINQSNNTEKGLQVQNMTSVYAAAKNTCLWLGQEEYDSARGLALLDDLALQTAETIKSFVITSSRKDDFRALVNIFERGYWDRLWCIQELEYSKRTVVYCGRHQAPWTTYLHVQSLFDSLRLTFSNMLSQFQSQRSRSWETVLKSNGPYAMRCKPCGNIPSRSTLIGILVLHRKKICMDPRDRIYAILGLIEPHKAARFPVDYNISVKTLFTKVVTHDVEETNRLDSICVSTRGNRNQFALPSWVPDWTTGEERIPLVHTPHGFIASGGNHSDAVFLNHRSKLQVTGIRIDTIETFYIRVPEDGYMSHIIRILSIWRVDICKQLGYDLSLHDSFSRVVTLGKTFCSWNTRQWTILFNAIIDDYLRIFCPEVVPDSKLFESLNQYADLPSFEGGLSDMFKEHVGSILSGRQISITRWSLLCVSSGLIDKGDTIFVLAGCSIPVVLRHLSGNEYKFIGEIFVDGYMTGKAMEDVAAGTRAMETVVLV